jgi:hypothetical protein
VYAGAAADVADLGGSGLEPNGPPGHERDSAAFLGELKGDGSADSSACTGDDDGSHGHSWGACTA